MFVVVLLVAVLVAGSAIFTGAAQDGVTWPASFVPTQNASSAVLPSESVYADIYNRVSPSVVSINVVARAQHAV
ncbi:MAG: hypothetical protein IPK19_21950 [Chloroflexi bacterium]|nr:hypothetical protein [Chloroflexota bacterium]